MKVLVTGAAGQLGRVVVEDAARRGHDVVGIDRPEASLDDADRIRLVIADVRPSFVVHCGALTDVDGCELEPEAADRINGHGTAYVAEACRAVDAGLVYVSTDYVFAGDASAPYTPDAPTAPRSAYGRSKLLGEQAVLRAPLPAGFYVARTSWVFGPGGRNFPAAILARARAGQPLRVVDDQVGCPTMTRDLAAALLDLGGSRAPSGIYHAANEGVTSWYDFAVEILRQTGIEVEVGRMSSDELDRPAPRPAHSALDCSKLTAVRGAALPAWQDGLGRYLAVETAE